MKDYTELYKVRDTLSVIFFKQGFKKQEHKHMKIQKITVVLLSNAT